MRKIVFAFSVLALGAGLCSAQVNKPWSARTKQEAEKILNDSAWGQTQTETDTSEMFYSPTKGGTSSIGTGSSVTLGRTSDQQAVNNNRSDRGATNQAVSINYHVRFLSAKPVREAISRMVMPAQHQPGDKFEELMQTFIDRDFSQYIVVI